MTARGPKATCDRYWSQLVRLRGACQYPGCGTPRNLEAAHIIRRRFVGDPDGLPLRTNLSNGWALCSTHHRLVDGDAVAFTELVQATIGMDAYQELVAVKNGRHRPWRERDWIAERARLKGMLDAAGKAQW